jgi:trans-aconitate 2-methyltransferase
VSDWKPDSYLKFKNERTQPAIDLVTRIQLNAPGRIIDIGCGPGNSTAVLKERWPDSDIIGLDSSAAMIRTAKDTHKDITWIAADAAGDLSPLGSFDLVFSNAALQWVPDHHVLLPKLFNMLRASGVLAAQVPYIEKMPLHTGLRQMRASAIWQDYLVDMAGLYAMHPPSFFYGILSRLTDRIDLWQTDYIHVMDSHAAIVQWFTATGLRPYLDALPSEELKNEFLRDFEGLVKEAYRPERNGKILFPFTRLFFIAQKS